MRSELRRAGRLRQIAVEPLDAAATAVLLERTLGPVAPSLHRAVLDRTDGVPFFVDELASALAAGGLLAGGELSDGAEVPLPEAVRDAVLLRAAGLALALDHGLTGAASEIYQRLADALEHGGAGRAGRWVGAGRGDGGARARPGGDGPARRRRTVGRRRGMRPRRDG